MSKEKRRVPKLRFPGFTEDWEQRKFGEIYERASQKNDLTYGIDKIISVANMYFKIDATVGSEEYLKTYNVFKLGDIAFEGHTNKEYSYGRFVENTIGDGIVSHIFDVFTPRINLDINFWKDLIKYEPIMGPILRRCTKASRMMSNLTSKEFLEEKILCPTLEEQKLIGEFIVRIDKNITLHQRKLEHLNLKKKALLQKLFPKNGERYPELRFPGFADAWEQCKLESLGKIITGNTPSTLKKEYWSANSEGVVWITPTDINSVKTDCSERLLTEEGASQARIVPANSILVTCIASIGKNTINTVEAAFNQQINALVPHLSNSYFILTMLNNMESAFKRVAGTSATSIINKKEFGQLSALLPSVEEQNKIGEIFELIDKSITLHQRKLEHLQLQKKALLQQLFI